MTSSPCPPPSQMCVEGGDVLRMVMGCLLQWSHTRSCNTRAPTKVRCSPQWSHTRSCNTRAPTKVKWYLQWLLTRSCITRILTKVRCSLQWPHTRSCITRTTAKVRCFPQWLHTRPQTLGSLQSPLPNSKARSSIRRTPTEVRRVIHKTGTKTLSKNVGLPAWPPPVRRE